MRLLLVKREVVRAVRRTFAEIARKGSFLRNEREIAEKTNF